MKKSTAAKYNIKPAKSTQFERLYRCDTTVRFSVQTYADNRRINFKLAKLCYLATSFQHPGYLADFVSPYSQSRLLRSSTHQVSVSSATELGHCCSARRFSVDAPRLWNSLPLNCRTAPSVIIFKIRLKTFLFDSA